MDWISVDDRLPKKDGIYPVLFREPFLPHSFEEYSIVAGWRTHKIVTHWLEIPLPPTKKRWMPRLGEEFFWIDGGGFIGTGGNVNIMKDFRAFLGCYKTREEAQQMLEAIKAFVTEKIGQP